MTAYLFRSYDLLPSVPGINTINFLTIINGLIFVTEMRRIFLEVGTTFLNIFMQSDCISN
jgi:hypothetical protein